MVFCVCSRCFELDLWMKVFAQTNNLFHVCVCVSKKKIDKGGPLERILTGTSGVMAMSWIRLEDSPKNEDYPTILGPIDCFFPQNIFEHNF